MAHKLIVGNLSNEVTIEQVRSVVEKFKDFQSIDPPSAGCCNVYFATKRGAQQAFFGMNNKMLGKDTMWCNTVLPYQRENVVSYTIMKIVPVTDITDTSEDAEKIRAEYEKYGKVNDVSIPKHLLDDDENGYAFITFEEERAMDDALTKEENDVWKPEYMVRSPETIHRGGYGGRYGFEDVAWDY